MVWFMWVFWGVIAAILIGAYLFDFLTGNKYERKEVENSLHQNAAEADVLREMDRYQNGMF